ncbi:AAA family ATPase [candidate division KSB1 bacterium]|nr:AAA family ATPase [candidate division KSB1 bacterium]
MINIEEPWQHLLNKISHEDTPLIVYVIGSNDSGKTTFCKYLAENLSKNFQIAYIDCDPGQSLIGPPTTVGLDLFPQSETENHLQCLYFVGSTTPRGHLLQTITGMKKLTEKAVSLGAQRIILDSCGFVLEQVAREFQFRVIDLIQPDFLIAIHSPDEDFRWVSNFRKHPGIHLYRLPISSSVIARTPPERRQYREVKFKDYFENAVSQELILRGIGFHGKIPDLRNPEMYRNVLVGLCDAENFLISLGIVQEINLAGRKIQIYAPRADLSKVVFIHFGSIYLNSEGQQIMM